MHFKNSLIARSDVVVCQPVALSKLSYIHILPWPGAELVCGLPRRQSNKNRIFALLLATKNEMLAYFHYF
jgi:hypothetical protein